MAVGADDAGRTRISAIARPPTTDIVLLVVAVFAASMSGPLIAAAVAPTLAVAFWRNAFASVVLVPWSSARRRAEIGGLRRRELALALGAGVLLAVHFALWVPSLSYTSVASATALVATQPIWLALIARSQGHDVPRRAWLGIGVAVVGAVAVSGADLSVSSRALGGDLLALGGAVFSALYMTVGAEVRQSVSTTTYTTLCYTTAAVALLGVCVVGGIRLHGYPAKTWLELVALTVGPQLLGHSLINRVLETTSPTVVGLSFLFQVPGAAVIAAAALGQLPPAGVLPGVALLLGGLALVLGGQPPSADVAEAAEGMT